MHRSAEGKSANRTLDVETGLANIQAVNFELDVVGPNREATGYKSRAHVSSHHSQRSWFGGCRSLLYHRSERSTNGHLALTVGSVQQNTTPKESRGVGCGPNSFNKTLRVLTAYTKRLVVTRRSKIMS